MIGVPAYVQKVYNRVLADGLPGGNADANPTIDISFIAENTDVPFGIAVSLGSSYGPPVRARIGSTGIQSASAGYAVGTGTPDTLVSDYTAITSGQFQLMINNELLKLEVMDFSAVTSMADVASVIQSTIRANVGGGAPFTAATCQFVLGQFIITAGTNVTSVTNIDRDQTGAGTDMLAMLGLDSVMYTAAQPAVGSAVMLGVTIRSLTEEGGPGSLSNLTTVRQGHIGALRVDGRIKVLCTDNCTAGAQVYFVPATGAIQGSSSGATALGTSTFKGNYAANTVGIIDVTGLR